MSASTYFNLAVQAFQRNNPVLEVVNRVSILVYNIINYKSNVKLTKYRHNLYLQQLKRMEGFLSEASPYQYRGGKMDRKF